MTDASWATLLISTSARDALGISGLCKGCMPLLHGDDGSWSLTLHSGSRHEGRQIQCCMGTPHTMHPLPPSTPSRLIVVNMGSSLCNRCQVGALTQYDLCWACGQEPPGSCLGWFALLGTLRPTHRSITPAAKQPTLAAPTRQPPDSPSSRSA